MAADPVVRPAAGQSTDVTLVGSGPRGVDIYVGPSAPTQLGAQRLDQIQPVAAGGLSTGTAAIALADFTSSASGTQTANDATGTAAVTLDAFTSSATGTETLTGTATVTAGDATSSATGTESITGTSATTLADSASTASGTHAENATGTAAITLADFTAQATGDGGAITPPAGGGNTSPGLSFKTKPSAPVVIAGTASITLDAFTSSATGTCLINFDAELEQLLLVGAI
jgi:hypothetical protein